jgi:hypothetical protein
MSSLERKPRKPALFAARGRKTFGRKFRSSYWNIARRDILQESTSLNQLGYVQRASNVRYWTSDLRGVAFS